MDEKKFLENFAKILGSSAQEELKKIEEKKLKEERLLKSFGAALSKKADFEIKIEEEIQPPRQVKLADEFIKKAPKIIVETPIVPVEAMIEEEVIKEEPVIEVANLVSEAVSATNVPEDGKKTEADLINTSLRKEIEVIKKSVANFHKLVHEQSRKIALAGSSHGGGEVNLRYLDDIDRSSIINGNFLKYNENTKKFNFANVTSDGVDWLHVPSSIIPEANIAYSLGNTSNYWNNLYINAINVPVGSVITSTLTVSPVVKSANLDHIVAYSSTSAAIPIGTYGNANEIPAPWAVYQLKDVPDPILQIDDLIAGTGVPLRSYLKYIGTGSYANLIIANTTFSTTPPENDTLLTITRDIINPSLSLTTTPNTNIALTPGDGGIIVTDADIVPKTTNVNRLGTPAKRFSEIWVGPGTIYVADETLGVDQALGAKDGNFYIKGGAGFQVGEFRLRDNQIAIANNERDILFGTTLATGNVVFNRPIAVKSYDTGKTTFSVNRTGRVELFAPTVPAGDVGAFSIIGSANGDFQPVTNPGGMLHITGNDGYSTRFNIDNFSTGNTSSFNAFIGRAGRGTANTPAALQANDIMLRIGTVGWKTESGFGGATVTSQSLDLVALETFYDNSRGTAFKFYNAPLGGSARTLSLTVDSNGIYSNNITSYSNISGNSATFSSNVYIGNVGVATKLVISGGANDQILVSNGTTLNWTPRHTDGSWTPVMIPATGSNVVFTVNNGKYVKVGPIVTAHFDIVVSSMGTASGALKLGGLPFTSLAGSAGNYEGTVSMGYFSDLNIADAIHFSGAVIQNSNTADLWLSKLNGQQISQAPMNTTDVKITSRFVGTVIYTTDF